MCQKLPYLVTLEAMLILVFFVALDLESYECEQPELTEEKERHKYLK